MSPEPEPPDLTSPPVTEAVVTDQLAAHATESGHGHGHDHPVHTHCENCGTALQGPFCHRCGQHDFDVHRSFGHVFLEALENFFHFDTKLFRNIVTLLFRPGRLTAEFNAGHRVAQMPPLRLYVFVSVLFFFVSFAGAKHGADDLARIDGNDPKELQELLAGKNPGGAEKPARSASPEDKTPAVSSTPPGEKPATAATVAGKPEEETEFERTLSEKANYALNHQHEMSEAFLHAIPKMLLVGLPLFALYTRFLFRKSGQVYLQHLIVAVHFHTFIFLWLLFRSGWGGLADLLSHTLHNWVVFACNVWLVVYPVVMLRNLYGNSWKRTLAKTVVLTLAYGATLGFVFFAAAVIIFATL